jgi:Putative DNA-binding domain
MPKSAPRLKPASKVLAPTPRLSDIQASMAQAIMRPLTADEGLQPAWVDGSPTSAVAARFIKPNDRLNSFERLQIYNQQYWWRLLSCFGEDGRGLRAVLGERKFDQLAVAYLERHGSTSWNLRNLGQYLESFLRERPELTAPHTALALDMARVEWARVVAFDDPELPPIDPQKVAQRAPARLRFRLQPYLVLLELHHPVDRLLRKLRESAIETNSASNAASGARTRRRIRLTARPTPEPIYLAVHRHQLSVFYKRLDREAYRLLTALRNGATLETACGEAFAESRDLPATSAAKIRQWFAQWTQFGWLCERRGNG